jgi:hypothetical protein
VTIGTLVRKDIFMSKILAKLSLESFEFPGAANGWLHFRD